MILSNFNPNCSTISATKFEYLCDMQYWIRGVVVLVISIIGILLNISIIYVIFPKKNEKNIFNVLLINLFTWDAIFLLMQAMIALIIYIFCPWKPDAAEKYGYSSSVLYMTMLRPIRNISLSQSIFFTVSLSLERFVFLIHPNAHSWLKKQISSRRSCYLRYALPITIFSFIFHIPSFFINENLSGRWFGNDMHNGTSNDGTCYIHMKIDTKIAKYFNNYGRLLVEGIIALVVLIYCNGMLYFKVRRHLRATFGQSTGENTETRFSQISESKDVMLRNSLKRISRSIEHQLAKAVFGIVIVFVICQIPNLVFRFWESRYIEDDGGCGNTELETKQDIPHAEPLWVLHLEMVVNVMLVVNSSINVLVYCILDDQYKDRVTSCINRICAKNISKNAQSKEADQNLEFQATIGIERQL
jgi:hypothetical protein